MWTKITKRSRRPSLSNSIRTLSITGMVMLSEELTGRGPVVLTSRRRPIVCWPPSLARQKPFIVRRIVATSWTVCSSSTHFASLGSSYRLNWGLPDSYQDVAQDPDYNLGLKKESWPPDPSRFINDARSRCLPVGPERPAPGLSVAWHVESTADV